MVIKTTVPFGSIQKKLFLPALVTLVTIGFARPTQAQTICPQCGQIHSSTVRSPTVDSSTGLTPSFPVATSPVSIAPVVISPGVTSTVATSPRDQTSRIGSSRPVANGVSNVIAMLNKQRSRQGIGTLTFDPALQAVAQRRAQQMASSRTKSHPPGSFAPGRYEGVGWSSSYTPGSVMACYTSDPNMRAAGAAMATGSDGVYFAVVYR